MIKLGKKYRLLVPFFGLILFLSNFYAASFGTFPTQIEKQTNDLEVKYSIGFVNPSSNPVNVSLSAEDSREYNLTIAERQFQLPSSTTDNPSGSGWYYLGDGEYTKIHERSFQVDISEFREDNRLTFPVSIEARSQDQTDSGTTSRSQLVQVRDYSFRAIVDPSLRPEDRPEQESDSWRDNFWQEENPDTEEDFNLDQDESINQSEPENAETQLEENKSGTLNQTKEKKDDSNSSNLTLILILGIMISLIYIWKEV